MPASDPARRKHSPLLAGRAFLGAMVRKHPLCCLRNPSVSQDQPDARWQSDVQRCSPRPTHPRILATTPR
eukprot:2319340-Rhodomonas_salina.1